MTWGAPAASVAFGGNTNVLVAAGELVPPPAMSTSGIMIAGGGLTAQLLTSEDSSAILPVLQQTGLPDADPTIVLPWKAEQFFLLISFVLFNLVGIALTLALLVWLVDRGLKRGKAETSADTKQVTTSQTATAQE